MQGKWTAAQERPVRDGYLDWSRMLARRRTALEPVDPEPGTSVEPVFVRLVDQTDVARQRLLDLARDPEAPLFMDPHEQAAVEAHMAAGPEAALPDEYALYRVAGTPDADHADLFAVLDTGMPVTAGERGAAADPGPPVPNPPAREALCADTPIVALIDDGIGFLNARFCRHDGTRMRSRFRSVWVQTLERVSTGTGTIVAGRVLDAARIDAMLAEGCERAAYARLNADLFGMRSRCETGYSTTHGTHVLDLAAGADPADTCDPVRDWPLLGVQLPPEAIDDTSGTWYENYMIQGLRWTLRQAHALNPQAPVIVNLSVGITAGPKDGSRFVEYQMAREAALWEEVMGQPVRLVWAFGNTYRGSQVARYTFAAEDTRTTPERSIAWRVQPDDETASYLEIRTRLVTSDRVGVAITAPDGTDSGFVALAEGQSRTLESHGKPLARIYHVPCRDLGCGTISPAHYLVALAPTRGQKAAEPVAPPGCWTVDIRYRDAGAAQVVFQVQRDDAMRGGFVRGRQSYLDHEDNLAWDAEEMAYVGFAPDGPVTGAGSHSSEVTAPGRQVICVGAARLSPRTGAPEAGNLRPSFYSAAGADWSVPGPTGATLADTGCIRGGVPGAGTLSGSVRRLAGTSAAAGRMSRALGWSAALIVANHGKPETTCTDDLDGERNRLIPTDRDRDRLGTVVVFPGRD